MTEQEQWLYDRLQRRDNNVFIQHAGDHHQVLRVSKYKYSQRPLAIIYNAGARNQETEIELDLSTLEALAKQVKRVTTTTK